MSRLPTPEEKKAQHRESFELGLCQRDYNLMAEHHPELLDRIEAAIQDGITPLQLKRWAVGVVDENQLVQRVFNAARFVETLEAAR